MKNKFLFIFLFLLLLFAGLLLQSNLTVKTVEHKENYNSSTTLMPQLFVIEQSTSSCLLKIYKNSPDIVQTWTQLSKCPEKTEFVIFDSPNNRLIVLQDGKYFTVEKKIGAEPKVLADAFKSPVEGEFYTKTWVDKKTKKLTVAYLIPVGQMKDNSEGDELRKSFPLLKDSWISAHHSDGSNPEGEPSIAIVAQLDSDTGKWQSVAQEKTSCCADLAPGFEAVKEFIDEDPGVYSLNELLLKTTCQEQQCDLSKLKPSEDTANWIKQTFKEGEEVLTAYMPLGSQSGFLFPTVFGDSLHAMGPIYFCQNECAKRTLIDSPKGVADFGQVSFSPKAEFMIVSTEYKGDDAKIYVAGSSKPVLTFDSKSQVIWLPDNFQF